MSKHTNAILSILTQERYFEDITGVVNEMLTTAPENAMAVQGLTVKEFRTIGLSFYSSKGLLRMICDAYTGRFVRMYG
jgi:hypothetical protein